MSSESIDSSELKPLRLVINNEAAAGFEVPTASVELVTDTAGPAEPVGDIGREPTDSDVNALPDTSKNPTVEAARSVHEHVVSWLEYFRAA